MKNKYLWIGASVICFVIILNYVGGRVMEQRIPPFIKERVGELRKNRALMDSIGGFDKLELTFNGNKFRARDTVQYRIKIVGTEKVLLYDGWQLCGPDGKWHLLRQNLTIE